MTSNDGEPRGDSPPGERPAAPGAPASMPPPAMAPTPLTPDPRPRSKTWLFVAIIAVVLLAGASLTTVLVLNHRADVAAQERRDEAERKAAAEKAAEEKAAEEKAAAELAAARDAYEGCSQQVKPLLNALQTVDARLDVGLTQSELSALVGKVSIAYNRMDVDELGTGTCLRVAVQLENAFNSYNSTVSQWNDCIFDYGCDTDGIMPGMQGKWLRSSTAIDRADGLLESLDPDSSDYDPETTANST